MALNSLFCADVPLRNYSDIEHAHGLGHTSSSLTIPPHHPPVSTAFSLFTAVSQVSLSVTPLMLEFKIYCSKNSHIRQTGKTLELF